MYSTSKDIRIPLSGVETDVLVLMISGNDAHTFSRILYPAPHTPVSRTNGLRHDIHGEFEGADIEDTMRGLPVLPGDCLDF